MPVNALSTVNIGDIKVFETVSNMLRPIYSVLNGDVKGTGNKTTLYCRGFEKKIETYAILNDIIIDSLPEHGECLIRVESKGYKEFTAVPICDLRQLVLDNPYKSFHEVLYKEISKMYFDVDS
jgi:hypothetical protein